MVGGEGADAFWTGGGAVSVLECGVADRPGGPSDARRVAGVGDRFQLFRVECAAGGPAARLAGEPAAAGGLVRVRAEWRRGGDALLRGVAALADTAPDGAAADHDRLPGVDGGLVGAEVGTPVGRGADRSGDVPGALRDVVRALWRGTRQRSMVERAVPAPCRDSGGALPAAAGLPLRAAGRLHPVRGQRSRGGWPELGGRPGVWDRRRRPAAAGRPAGGALAAVGGVRGAPRSGAAVDRAGAVPSGRAGAAAAGSEGGAVVRRRAVVPGMGGAADGGGGALGATRDRRAGPDAAGMGRGGHPGAIGTRAVRVGRARAAGGRSDGTSGRTWSH